MTDWVKQLPTITLPTFLGIMMLEKSLPSSSQIPDLWHYNKVLQAAIRKAGHDIMRASTGDAAILSEKRMNLLQGEQKALTDKVRAVAARLFEMASFSCIGSLNGKKVIIPAEAWTGEMDWDKEVLIFDNQRYSQLGVLFPQFLSQEQMTLVAEHVQIAGGSSKPALPPGRPSYTHLIETEYQRRKDEGIVEKSLSAESDYLATWFKKRHPDKRPVTPKTIANKIRDDFRAYQQKTA